MPSFETASSAGKKRKRENAETDRKQIKQKSKRQSPSEDTHDDPQAAILKLEAQIVESRRHYNNIAILLETAKQEKSEDDVVILAAVALCRVFSRLLRTCPGDR